MPFLQTPSFEQLHANPPVIIVGMHRSGTSLLTRLMIMLGVHMGSDLDANAESKHIRGINKHTFKVASVDWNTPQGVIDLMAAPAVVDRETDHYRSHLFVGAGGLLYWGTRTWFDLQLGHDLPRWGWKDPRTSLTLPIWLQLFPDAKVVHIMRDGIDVAISLHRRQIAKTRRWRVPADHRDPRGFDFRYCFSLWEIYQRHLMTYREMVPAAQYVELRYETLLREPEATLRNVLAKIEHPVDEAQLSGAISMINTARLDNSAYAEPYQHVIAELRDTPLMAELGYDSHE